MARPSKSRNDPRKELPPEEWGRRLRHARIKSGIDTGKQAAALLGMSEVQLSQLERGRRSPTGNTLYRIVHGLGLDPKAIADLFAP